MKNVWRQSLFRREGVSFELKGDRLNPYHLIERMKYDGCNEAVRNIAPKIATALPEIEKMILEIPVLTDTQKKFYLAVMEQRYEKVLKPTCQKIMGQQMAMERQPKGRGADNCLLTRR